MTAGSAVPDATSAAQPSAAVREELAQASRSLEQSSPAEIIAWAVGRYGARLTMATAFGPEGCLIIHWLAAIAPRTFVFNLDTGYQFPETLALRDQIAARYGVEVSLERPETSVADYERLHGGPLYRAAPDRCCGDRKLAVIRRVLVGTRARIGRRRRSSAGITSSAWSRSRRWPTGRRPWSGTRSSVSRFPTTRCTIGAS
jgi:phosphoadenosine phosphosulfate reductase